MVAAMSGPVGVVRVCMLEFAGRCVRVATTEWLGLPCCGPCAERNAELDAKYPVGQYEEQAR
jgi:hypothetical protein